MNKILSNPVSGMVSDGILRTSYATNTILNGGEFGPEGGLFVTVVVLLGFLFVRYYYKDKNFSFFSMDADNKNNEQ